MIKKIFLLVFLTGISAVSFAQVQTSLSQVERSQELINENESLRKRVEGPEKNFIKEIILIGINLSEKRFKELISPYEKRWLSKYDIRLIVDSLENALKKDSGQAPEISYEVKGQQLILKAEAK